MMEYIKQVCCFRGHNKQETTLVHPVTKETAIQAEAIQSPPQQTLRPEDPANNSSNVAVPNMEAKKSPRKRVTGGNLRPPTVKRSNQAPVSMQGWLWKQGSDGFMRWKKRWFVLADFCLFYYKGPDEEKILGSILLPSYKISPCSNEGRVLRKFAFKAEHQNMRTYYFAADSKESAQQWMNAMSLASILQRDPSLSDRHDPSHRSDSHNTSTANEDEDSGFTSYHSRRYLGSPQHDGNSTLNGSFASDPGGRLRADELHRDTASDSSHAPNERLVDGYLGSADKYPTSYAGPHPHFYNRNPNNPGGNGRPPAGYTNPPPKPKRLANQEVYGPSGGQHPPPTEQHQYIDGQPMEYPDYREEYPQYTGHPNEMMGVYANPQVMMAGDGGKYRVGHPQVAHPQEWVPQYEVYPGDYPNYPTHVQQPAQVYHSNHRGHTGRNDEANGSSQPSNDPPAYRDEYDPAVLREKGQRIYLAQRPHSANFLEYDYNPEEIYRSQDPSSMVRRPRSTKGTAAPTRPKSSIEQYDPDEYWSEQPNPAVASNPKPSYPQPQTQPHQVPHTPHTQNIPHSWESAQNNPAPGHDTSFESYSSSQGEGAARSPRGNNGDNSYPTPTESNGHGQREEPYRDGYPPEGKVASSRMAPTAANQARTLPRDAQFLRSASARLPSSHEMVGLPPYSRDDSLADNDPRRVQQREESMKRLLEWKQRMLQSPLTKKYPHQKSPQFPMATGIVNHPIPPVKKPEAEEYRKQVLQELANNEANKLNQGGIVPHMARIANQERSPQIQRAGGQPPPKRDAEGTNGTTNQHQQQFQPKGPQPAPNGSLVRSADNKHLMSATLNRYRNSYSSDDEDENVSERKRTRRPPQAGRARNSGGNKRSPRSNSQSSSASSPDYVNITVLNESLLEELAQNAMSKHEYENFPLRRHRTCGEVRSDARIPSADNLQQEVDNNRQRRRQWEPDEVHSDGDIERYPTDVHKPHWMKEEMHNSSFDEDPLCASVHHQEDGMLDKNVRVYRSMREAGERGREPYLDREERKYKSMRNMERSNEFPPYSNVAQGKESKSKSLKDISPSSRHPCQIDVGVTTGSMLTQTSLDSQKKEYRDECVQTSFPYESVQTSELHHPDRGCPFDSEPLQWQVYDRHSKPPPSSYDDHSTGKYSDSGYDTLRHEGSVASSKQVPRSQWTRIENERKPSYDSEDSVLLQRGADSKRCDLRDKASSRSYEHLEGELLSNLIASGLHRSSQHSNLNRSFESDCLDGSGSSRHWSPSMSHSALYEKHIQNKQAWSQKGELEPALSTSSSAGSPGSKMHMSPSSLLPPTTKPRRNNERAHHEGCDSRSPKLRLTEMLTNPSNQSSASNKGDKVATPLLHSSSEEQRQTIISSKKVCPQPPHINSDNLGHFAKSDAKHSSPSDKTKYDVTRKSATERKFDSPRRKSDGFVAVPVQPKVTLTTIPPSLEKDKHSIPTYQMTARSTIQHVQDDYQVLRTVREDKTVKDHSPLSANIEHKSSPYAKYVSPMESQTFEQHKVDGATQNFLKDYNQYSDYDSKGTDPLASFLMPLPYGANELGFLQDRPTTLTEKVDRFRKQKEIPPKNIVQERIRIFEAAGGEIPSPVVIKNADSFSHPYSKKTGNVRQQLQNQAAFEAMMYAKHCDELGSEQHSRKFKRRRFHSDTDAILYGDVTSSDDEGNNADDDRYIVEALNPQLERHFQSGHLQQTKNLQSSPVSEVIITPGALRLSMSDNSEFQESLDSAIVNNPDQSTTALNMAARRRSDESVTSKDGAPYYGHLHSTPLPANPRDRQQAEEYYIPMGAPGNGVKSWLFEKGVKHLEKEEAVYVQMDDQGFLSRSTDSKSSDSRSPASTMSKKTPGTVTLSSGNEYSLLADASSGHEYSLLADASSQNDLCYDSPYKTTDYEPIYAELKHASRLQKQLDRSERAGHQAGTPSSPSVGEADQNSKPHLISLPDPPSSLPLFEDISANAAYNPYIVMYENIVPDLLAGEKSQVPGTPSSASDADDEASKDFNHPRFSMSDSFRPASYYLKSKVFQGLERPPDSSDEDLESPPPIPQSPPPMEELEHEHYMHNLKRQQQLQQQKQQCEKWSNSEDECRTYFTADDVMNNSDKTKPSPSPNHNFPPPLSPLQSELNYSYYRVYEDDRRYTELMFKPTSPTVENSSSQVEQRTATSVRKAVTHDEGKRPTSAHRFPKDSSRSGLSRSSESTDFNDASNSSSSSSTDTVSLRPQPDVTSSGRETATCMAATSDDKKDLPEVVEEHTSPHLREEKPSNTPSPLSAPYYYSDLLKNEGSLDEAGPSRSASERSLHHSPRGRIMLNNSRAISPASPGRRDDVGRKVNKIQSPLVSPTHNASQECLPSPKQMVAELSHSIEYLEAKKLTDVSKNTYESDTLRAQRHHRLSSVVTSRFPDTRNMYPHGLRDKSQPAPNHFALPRQRRSRSLEGLLDGPLGWGDLQRPFLDDAPSELRMHGSSVDDFELSSSLRSNVGPSTMSRHAIPSALSPVSRLLSATSSTPSDTSRVQYPDTPFLGQRGGCGSGGGAAGCSRRTDSDRRLRQEGRRVSRSLDELDDEGHFLRGEREYSHSDFIIDREKLRQWDMMSSAPFLSDESQSSPNGRSEAGRSEEKPEFWEQKRMSKSSEDSVTDRRATFANDTTQFLLRTSKREPTNRQSDRVQLHISGSHYLGKNKGPLFNRNNATHKADVVQRLQDLNNSNADKSLLSVDSGDASNDTSANDCDADCSQSSNSDSCLSDVPLDTSITVAMVAINDMYTEHSETEVDGPTLHYSASSKESHIISYGPDVTYTLDQQLHVLATTATTTTNHGLACRDKQPMRDDLQADPAIQQESGSGSLKGLFISRTQPRQHGQRGKNEFLRDDLNMSDSELQVRGKLQNAKIRKYVHHPDGVDGGGSNSPRLSISAGDLLGKTHEELILLLIQLRRTQAKLQKAIDTCQMELEGEKKLLLIDTKNRDLHSMKVEELSKQLEEYAKQFDLSKPMVNLVDNMVKLGSLYGGSEQVLTSQYRLNELTPEEYAPPKKMIEFTRRLQEQRLLKEERLEWSQLVPDQADLQGKLQQLYQLDRCLQEESVNLTNLHQEKDMLERALLGIQAKANESGENVVEQERLLKQQRLVERELGKVHTQLVHTTKKLEETAAENAHIEHEILLLRQKIQQTLKMASAANPNISSLSVDDVETTELKLQLEEELAHVQNIMDELGKRRQEISGAVEQLKDKGHQVRPSPTGVAGSAPLPGRKFHRSTYLETDLDTMVTRDILDVSSQSDEGSPIPTHLPHAYQRSSQVPLYVNTNAFNNKTNGVYALTGTSSDYPPPPAPDDYHEAGDQDDLYGRQDINEADDRMKRFYGIIPREKPAEIKTVRIVKRESERRNKSKDRKKVSYDEQLLSKVIEEPDALLFEDFDYYEADYQSNEFQRSMSLPRNYGRATYLPASMQEGIPMMPPNSLPLTNSAAVSTTAVTTTTVTTTKILPNVPYYYRTPSLTSSDRAPTAHERLFGSGNPPLGSVPPTPDSPSSASPLATPVFKSEAARQIVAETAQQLMASLTSDPLHLSLEASPGGDTGSLKRRHKRRHYTISSSQPVALEAAPPKLVHARSRDDLDIERCLRSANTPDVVKSTIKKSDNFDESTIDRELGLPQKIVIPERYIEQEEEEPLSAEEKLHRIQKTESIRKMLSESTTYGDLSENEIANASETLKKKYEQEKKQREQLLSLNQLLAQEVKERSKAVAARAMQNLPELSNIKEEEDEDLSPVQPLPTVQQRENFLT